MKIYERKKKAGSLYVGLSDSDRFKNAYTANLGSSSGYCQYAGVKATDGDTPAYWNVFQNGVMVQCGLDTNEDFYETGGGGNSPYRTLCVDKTAKRSGDGRYGRNGPGEPITVDGRSYKVRFLGFGINGGTGDQSYPDELARYIEGSEPSGVWGSSSGYISVMSVDDCSMGSSSAPMTWAQSTDGGVSFTRMYRRDTVNLVLMAIPDTYRTVVDFVGLDWEQGTTNYSVPGTMTQAGTISAVVSHEGGGSIDSVKAFYDGEEFYSSGPVASGSTVSIDLSGAWDKIPSGDATITVRAGSGDAASYDLSVTIKKRYGNLEVQGNPEAVAERPTACSIVCATVFGAGAVASWQVTNNALDPSPSWEDYEGDYHEFSNASCESGTWAVAWRLRVDGGAATARSELVRQVGMAVV